MLASTYVMRHLERTLSELCKPCVNKKCGCEQKFFQWRPDLKEEHEKVNHLLPCDINIFMRSDMQFWRSFLSHLQQADSRVLWVRMK